MEFNNRKRGQSITEYLILTALIGIGSMAVISVLSRNVRTQLAVIAEEVGFGDANPRAVRVHEEDYQRLNMDDFGKDSRSSE